MKFFEYFIPYEAITCDQTDPPWLAKKTLFIWRKKMSNILLEKFEAIISIIFSSFFVKQCWLSDNGIAKQCPLVDNGSRTPSLFPIHAHLHTHTNRQAVYQKLLACLLLPMCNSFRTYSLFIVIQNTLSPRFHIFRKTISYQKISLVLSLVTTISQLTFTCAKSLKQKIEKGVKYVQS